HETDGEPGRRDLADEALSIPLHRGVAVIASVSDPAIAGSCDHLYGPMRLESGFHDSSTTETAECFPHPAVIGLLGHHWHLDRCTFLPTSRTQGDVMSAEVTIVEARLSRDRDARDVRAMTAAYAMDPMGNGGALAEDVLDRLIPGLQQCPGTLIFLAYLDERAVGIATCFAGFSTFQARPLINIHDLAVIPDVRGHGIGRRLLAVVEARARELGCCKLTLEVQENNRGARRLYVQAGFAQAVYGDA